MLRLSHAMKVGLLAGCFVAGGAFADQATLTTMKDNTLYQSAPDNPLSNGSGPGMYCGKNGGGLIRRALMRFDIASAVPAGSTINSVTLRLQCMQAPNSTARSCSLYRVLADWGESISVASGGGGGGDIAGPGDASWFNRFEPTATTPAIPWSTAGGQFAAASSATATVNGYGAAYTWGSTAQLVADAQFWLDNPQSNFGWILRGVETSSQTARKFATREETNVAFRPKLTIDYTPPATCGDIDFNNDELFPDTQDIADFIEVFGGGACSSGNCDTIDFNNDGLFPDTDDISAFLRVFSGGEC
ncbi:MAG TPA: DNRLRE domain-containing protein [Phycisphaerales bacterium]|nr:DNRLRE domain-containing protein [Phycisphaerales bacterium]